MPRSLSCAHLLCSCALNLISFVDTVPHVAQLYESKQRTFHLPMRRSILPITHTSRSYVFWCSQTTSRMLSLDEPHDRSHNGIHFLFRLHLPLVLADTTSLMPFALVVTLGRSVPQPLLFHDSHPTFNSPYAHCSVEHGSRFRQAMQHEISLYAVAQKEDKGLDKAVEVRFYLSFGPISSHTLPTHIIESDE